MSIDVPRDQYGRPKIVMPDGKTKAYTRVSSMAKVLDNQYNLNLWKQRMAVKGVVLDPGLLAQARQLDVKADRKAFDEICEKAMDLAGSKTRANLGTAMHAITEDHDLGRPMQIMEDWQKADLQAYVEATANLTVLSAEQFVVEDTIEVAGTYDRIYQTPKGRKLLGDLKTGDSDPDFAAAVMRQTAMYARGWLYTPETGRTHKLEDLGVSLTTGLLIHLPAGQGICNIYELNLIDGWTGALMSAEVKKRQAVDKSKKSRPVRVEF